MSAERWYRLALRAYPRAFRQRFASGMRYSFAADLSAARRRGRVAAAAFCGRSLSNALLLGFAERLRIQGPRRLLPLTGKQLGSHTPRPGVRAALMTVADELKVAVRRLRRQPGFTVASTVTLALALGATTAIYAVVHAVVINPLPYPDSDRLVSIWHSAPGADIDRVGTSSGAFAFYVQQAREFAALAKFTAPTITLSDRDRPARVRAAIVSGEFFGMLVDEPLLLGRPLVPSDDSPTADRVAVISAALWQRHYGGDPGVLDQALLIQGNPVRIVGVAPQGFDFPEVDTEVWLPERLDPAELVLGGFNSQVIGRLRDGATVASARAELAQLIPRLNDPYAGPVYDMVVTQGRLQAHVVALHDDVVGGVRSMLWILLAAVVFVLVTAAANVVNLFLVRAAGTGREVAVRTALGAGRGRVVLYFASEAALLAGVATLVGLGLAVMVIDAVKTFGPALPRLHEVGLTPPVATVAVSISFLAATILGLVPALRARPQRLLSTLREGGRGSTQGPRGVAVRNGLVAAQVALALVLLIGAGLMVRSFMALSRVEPGFEAQGVQTFRLVLSGLDYPDGAATSGVQRELIERIVALPGVERAGGVSCLPMSGCNPVNPLYEEGVPFDENSVPPAVWIHSHTPGYLETMSIRLVAGRLPTWADLDDNNGATVINAALARRFWPDEDPIGKRVFPDLPMGNPWYEIVGVVDDVHEESLVQAPPPVIYLPLLNPNGQGPNFSLAFAVRTSDGLEGFGATVQRIAREMNPNLVIEAVRPMSEYVDRDRAPTAFAMVLLVSAGAVALVLGTVGVYGVLSYAVRLRTSEIGIRMALGAAQGDVQRMVLRQGARVALPGLALGLLGALALGRVMATLLFGVRAEDPLTLTSGAVGLALVALFASYLPARRAASVQPVDALRS